MMDEERGNCKAYFTGSYLEIILAFAHMKNLRQADGESREFDRCDRLCYFGDVSI